MRIIGLLGGMSWQSTAEYYRLANERVAQVSGGYHSARMVVDSVDFAEIERMQVGGDWDAAGRLLAGRARALEAAGAELIVLCTNTMHIVADAIERAISVPFLHLADATADAVRREHVETVGLLGTAFTMEQPFYRDRLSARGLTVLTPNAADMRTVHRIIYDELVVGVTADASRDAYRGVIERLVENGAAGIILGCTEIELLVSQSDSPVPVFPTTRLHVDAAVTWALERDDSART